MTILNVNIWNGWNDSIDDSFQPIAMTEASFSSLLGSKLTFLINVPEKKVI